MKKLILIDLLLLAAFIGFFLSDRGRERAADLERAARSRFHPLIGASETETASLARIIITVPEAWKVTGFEKTRKWTYVKSGDRWRLAEFDDVDGFPDEIENFAKSVLSAKGTAIGTAGTDSARYGLTAGGRLDVECADAAGSVFGRASFGLTAPGERGDECYAVGRENELILRIDQNPWNMLAANQSAKLPPFIDLGVVPRSLRRGLPERIRFSGENASVVKEIFRREIPKAENDPSRAEDRGPRYEWFGITAAGEQRISTVAAYEVAGFLMRLTCDGFGPQKKRIKDPQATFTVDWGGGQIDVFEVGAAAQKGIQAVWFSGTDRITWISVEKARGFQVNAGRLLDLSLDQKPSAPDSKPAVR